MGTWRSPMGIYMRKVLRSIVILLLAGGALPPGVRADETVHAYVVGSTLPGHIIVDDYSAGHDSRIVLDISAIPSAQLTGGAGSGVLRVGDEVEIKGKFKSGSGNFNVASIKILSSNARRLNSTAFPDQPPELQKTPAGWTGTFFVDGLRVHVADSTAVTFSRNKSEFVEARSENNGVAVPRKVALASLSGIGPATMAHYEGTSQDDGSVVASKVDFEDFELLPREAKLLEKMAPTIQKGDVLISQRDELQVGRSKYKLLPPQMAQDYVQKLGERLIPPHQKELAADSPLRIEYHFYIAEDKDPNVLTFPNGVIIVQSGLFNSLENEAQLAFYLAQAVAQVEERQILRFMRRNPTSGQLLIAAAQIGADISLVGVPVLGAVEGYEAVRNGKDSSLDFLADQTDRLALEWMLAAGYDIREAPRAYKVYVLTHPDHTQLSPHPDPVQAEKDSDYAARRAFLMTELRCNYSQSNFATLSSDSEEFHQAARQVRQIKQ